MRGRRRSYTCPESTEHESGAQAGARPTSGAGRGRRGGTRATRHWAASSGPAACPTKTTGDAPRRVDRARTPRAAWARVSRIDAASGVCASWRALKGVRVRRVVSTHARAFRSIATVHVSWSAAAVLVAVSFARVAAADVVYQRPPSFCPPGMEPQVSHSGSWCGAVQTTPCPLGAVWRTHPDAPGGWCAPTETCGDLPWRLRPRDGRAFTCNGGDPCWGVSLCVEEDPKVILRFVPRQVVHGPCAPDGTCPSGSNCDTAYRCILPQREFADSGLGRWLVVVIACGVPLLVVALVAIKLVGRGRSV